MKGIQVCSNEGPRIFPRGDNNEIAKLHGRNFKIFSRSTGPGSVKLDTKHPYLKWTECIFLFFNQRYGIVIAFIDRNFFLGERGGPRDSCLIYM